LERSSLWARIWESDLQFRAPSQVALVVRPKQYIAPRTKKLAWLPNDDNLGTPIRAEHYNLWRAHFGEIQMPGIGAGGAIPEPGSFVLAAVGLLRFGGWRSRQVTWMTREGATCFASARNVSLAGE
jgi:hypothetical protein